MGLTIDSVSLDTEILELVCTCTGVESNFTFLTGKRLAIFKDLGLCDEELLSSLRLFEPSTLIVLAPLQELA